MDNTHTKAAEKEAAPAAGKGNGLKKAPVAEGIIRISVPGYFRGSTGAYMEIRGKQEAPSAIGVDTAEPEARAEKRFPNVIFSEGHLEVGGKNVIINGAGKRKGKGGGASACVIIFDHDDEKEDVELDLLMGEEGSFCVGGAECRLSLASPYEKPLGPNDDTNPVYTVPEQLLSGEEENWDGIRFRTLAKGEAMKLEVGYLLRNAWEAPVGNARLEILDEEEGKVAEFDGAEGDSFKIELAGVEKKYMLKIMELREATGGVDLFVFPKNEEKCNAEVK